MFDFEIFPGAGGENAAIVEGSVNHVGGPEQLAVADIDYFSVAGDTGTIVSFTGFVPEVELVDEDVEDAVGKEFSA